MTFILGILTFLLVVNCAVLALLILVQLPKKDAGAGLAFGGGTADALFGAGSGNALTKITKWATIVFIGLAVILGALEARLGHPNQSQFERGVEQHQQMGTPIQQPQVNPRPNTPQRPSTPAPAASPSQPVYPATNGAPAANTQNNGK